MSLPAFLAYWIVAFFVLGPFIVAAILYDLRRDREWPLVLKRVTIGVLVAVALGSVLVSHVMAMEVRDTIPAVCATLSGCLVRAGKAHSCQLVPQKRKGAK